VLGVLGVAFTNSLIESDLFYPQLKKGVGGCWGCWGWCWGWCWAKKCPPKSGGDGYFACKGGAKLRRSLRRRGGLGGFWRPFCGALGAVWGVFRTFALWLLCRSEV